LGQRPRRIAPTTATLNAIHGARTSAKPATALFQGYQPHCRPRDLQYSLVRLTGMT
jgi:hypothetical protein